MRNDTLFCSDGLSSGLLEDGTVSSVLKFMIRLGTQHGVHTNWKQHCNVMSTRSVYGEC